MYDREDYETNLEAVCEQNGLGVIPYFSLAAGFLTGKYRSDSDLGNKPRSSMVKKYMNDRGRRILAALDKVAKEYAATPARVSLAWMIARPSITAPIASATNLNQLNELIGATQLHLDNATVEELNQASAYAETAVAG